MITNNSILLTLASGKPVSLPELAEIGGMSTDLMAKHLDTLIAAGVDIKQDQGVISWVEPFKCLDSRLIQNSLSDYSELCVKVSDCLPSTNSVLADLECIDKVIVLCLSLIHI